MCNSVSLKMGDIDHTILSIQMGDIDHMILTIQNNTRKNGVALGVYSVISL